MKSVLYNYRICKSTWGVAIDIEAVKCSKSALVDSYEVLMEGVYLSDKIGRLTESEKRAMKIGCYLLSVPFERLVNGEFVVVLGLDFNFTDYQEEGLSFAFAELLGILFVVKLKDYEVFFDVDLNKYIYIVEGEFYNLFVQSLLDESKV